MPHVFKTLKILGKHFVIVSLDLKVIDVNYVIQTPFARMEANARPRLADVIAHPVRP